MIKKLSVEKREVSSPVMFEGSQGVFVHDKYFLRREGQYGDFTSISHTEALDLVVGLLQYETVRNGVARLLPDVVARSYQRIVSG